MEGRGRGRVVPVGAQFAWQADTAEQRRMHVADDPFQNTAVSIRDSQSRPACRACAAQAHDFGSADAFSRASNGRTLCAGGSGRLRSAKRGAIPGEPIVNQGDDLVENRRLLALLSGDASNQAVHALDVFRAAE